jgi:hypothetical protein
MAARKKKDAVPVRVPPKLGTEGPESGPTGETVVDADAPSPLSDHHPATKAAQAKQAKAQKAAENVKADREVKVRVNAKGPGYIGDRLRYEGETFTLKLAAGQKFPSWVDPVDPKEATTPASHSAEAQVEFVAPDGSGKKINSDDVL